MTNNYKRKPYRIVNKSHQYRFLAIVLIYSLIVAGVLVLALFIPDFIRLNDQNLSIEVRAVAANDILMLHSRVWPVIFALLCFIGLHSTRMFNRFVGPLYRFTVTFRDVQKGNLDNRIRLRKNDFLLKEADVINDMLDVINQKVNDIQLKGQYALELLSKLELEKQEDGAQTETDKKNIAALRKNLYELTASANYFNTRKP